MGPSVQTSLAEDVEADGTGHVFHPMKMTPLPSGWAVHY